MKGLWSGLVKNGLFWFSEFFTCLPLRHPRPSEGSSIFFLEAPLKASLNNQNSWLWRRGGIYGRLFGQNAPGQFRILLNFSKNFRSGIRTYFHVGLRYYYAEMKGAVF